MMLAISISLFSGFSPSIFTFAANGTIPPGLRGSKVDKATGVHRGDTVLVEVYGSANGDKFLGYLQACEASDPDRSKKGWTGHLCAYAPKQNLEIGNYGDPATLGSASFLLPGTKSGTEESTLVACPCDYPGTVPWYPTSGSPHSSKTETESDWQLTGDGSPVLYDTLYSVNNIAWKGQYLGYSSNCDWGGKRDKKYCLKLNSGAVVAFKIKNPAPSSPWGPHGGQWSLAASNNGDIAESLTTGMSWSSSDSVTQTDQVSLSDALEVDGEFFGSGAKETVTISTSHSWSHEVTTSKTTTTTSTCTGTCHKTDLPKGAFGWDLYQWSLMGQKSSQTLTTDTCNFLCIPKPNFKEPQCPPSCCADVYCQTCGKCFENRTLLFS